MKLKFLVGAEVARDAVGEVRSLVDDDDDVSDRYNWHCSSQYKGFYEHHITTFLVHINRTEF